MYVKFTILLQVSYGTSNKNSLRLTLQNFIQTSKKL